MRAGSPSRTAAGAAFRRAAHQLIDAPPVFIDPLARRLLSEEAQAQLAADPWYGNRGRMRSRLRAFLAVRSRIAEETLAQGVAEGIRQYVVLGAGLDTFAYRNPYPDVRVFEVDHPQTQRWKQERLRAASVSVPGTTVYVPIDFHETTIAHALAAHGFDAGVPTVISWLGVVPYLGEEAVWTTVAWAAGVAGHLVFDYGSRPRWWQLGSLLANRWLSARVAAAGEPFRTRLDPAVVHRRLLAAGFDDVRDLNARELTRRYFSGRSDGLRVAGSGHVVIASRAQ